MLNLLVNNAISRKAEFESAYAFSLVVVVFSSALWFSLKNAYENHGIVGLLIKVWLEIKGEDYRELFYRTFEYGYKKTIVKE